MRAPSSRRRPSFGRPRAVRGLDLFDSPPIALEPLFEHEPLLSGIRTVAEPACGKGNLVIAMRARGITVHASDIINRDCPNSTVLDFYLAELMEFRRFVRPRRTERAARDRPCLTARPPAAATATGKRLTAQRTRARAAPAGAAPSPVLRSPPCGAPIRPKVPKAAGHLPGKRFCRDRYASIAIKFRSGVKRRDVPSQADIGT